MTLLPQNAARWDTPWFLTEISADTLPRVLAGVMSKVIVWSPRVSFWPSAMTISFFGRTGDSVPPRPG